MRLTNVFTKKVFKEMLVIYCDAHQYNINEAFNFFQILCNFIGAVYCLNIQSKFSPF